MVSQKYLPYNHYLSSSKNVCMQRDSGIGGITIGPVSRSRGHGAANGHHGHGVVGSMGDMIIGNQVPSLTNIFCVLQIFSPQPPLDVDAILLRGQQQSLTTRQSADGSMCRSPVENRKR